MTEVDKYAKGATKPGGYAAQGYYKDGSGATVAVVAQAAASTAPADTAFLSTRPPWTCSVCKVTCTSQDTLLGHAAGVKHRRRVCSVPPLAVAPSFIAVDASAFEQPELSQSQAAAGDSFCPSRTWLQLHHLLLHMIKAACTSPSDGSETYSTLPLCCWPTHSGHS